MVKKFWSPKLIPAFILILFVSILVSVESQNIYNENDDDSANIKTDSTSQRKDPERLSNKERGFYSFGYRIESDSSTQYVKERSDSFGNTEVEYGIETPTWHHFVQYSPQVRRNNEKVSSHDQNEAGSPRHRSNYEDQQGYKSENFDEGYATDINDSDSPYEDLNRRKQVLDDGHQINFEEKKEGVEFTNYKNREEDERQNRARRISNGGNYVRKRNNQSDETDKILELQPEWLKRRSEDNLSRGQAKYPSRAEKDLEERQNYYHISRTDQHAPNAEIITEGDSERPFDDEKGTEIQYPEEQGYFQRLREESGQNSEDLSEALTGLRDSNPEEYFKSGTNDSDEEIDTDHLMPDLGKERDQVRQIDEFQRRIQYGRYPFQNQGGHGGNADSRRGVGYILSEHRSNEERNDELSRGLRRYIYTSQGVSANERQDIERKYNQFDQYRHLQNPESGREEGDRVAQYNRRHHQQSTDGGNDRAREYPAQNRDDPGKVFHIDTLHGPQVPDEEGYGFNEEDSLNKTENDSRVQFPEHTSSQFDEKYIRPSQREIDEHGKSKMPTNEERRKFFNREEGSNDKDQDRGGHPIVDGAYYEEGADYKSNRRVNIYPEQVFNQEDGDRPNKNNSRGLYAHREYQQRGEYPVQNKVGDAVQKEINDELSENDQSDILNNDTNQYLDHFDQIDRRPNQKEGEEDKSDSQQHGRYPVEIRRDYEDDTNSNGGHFSGIDRRPNQREGDRHGSDSQQHRRYPVENVRHFKEDAHDKGLHNDTTEDSNKEDNSDRSNDDANQYLEKTSEHFDEIGRRPNQRETDGHGRDSQQHGRYPIEVRKNYADDVNDKREHHDTIEESKKDVISERRGNESGNQYPEKNSKYFSEIDIRPNQREGDGHGIDSQQHRSYPYEKIRDYEDNENSKGGHFSENDRRPNQRESDGHGSDSQQHRRYPYENIRGYEDDKNSKEGHYSGVDRRLNQREGNGHGSDSRQYGRYPYENIRDYGDDTNSKRGHFSGIDRRPNQREGDGHVSDSQLHRRYPVDNVRDYIDDTIEDSNKDDNSNSSKDDLNQYPEKTSEHFNGIDRRQHLREGDGHGSDSEKHEKYPVKTRRDPEDDANDKGKNYDTIGDFNKDDVSKRRGNESGNQYPEKASENLGGRQNLRDDDEHGSDSQQHSRYPIEVRRDYEDDAYDKEAHPNTTTMEDVPYIQQKGNEYGDIEQYGRYPIENKRDYEDYGNGMGSHHDTTEDFNKDTISIRGNESKDQDPEKASEHERDSEQHERYPFKNIRNYEDDANSKGGQFSGIDRRPIQRKTDGHERDSEQQGRYPVEVRRNYEDDVNDKEINHDSIGDYNVSKRRGNKSGNQYPQNTSEHFSDIDRRPNQREGDEHEGGDNQQHRRYPVENVRDYKEDAHDKGLHHDTTEDSNKDDNSDRSNNDTNKYPEKTSEHLSEIDSRPNQREGEEHERDSEQQGRYPVEVRRNYEDDVNDKQINHDTIGDYNKDDVSKRRGNESGNQYPQNISEHFSDIDRRPNQREGDEHGGGDKQQNRRYPYENIRDYEDDAKRKGGLFSGNDRRLNQREGDEHEKLSQQNRRYPVENVRDYKEDAHDKGLHHDTTDDSNKDDNSDKSNDDTNQYPEKTSEHLSENDRRPNQRETDGHGGNPIENSDYGGKVNGSLLLDKGGYHNKSEEFNEDRNSKRREDDSSNQYPEQAYDNLKGIKRRPNQREVDEHRRNLHQYGGYPTEYTQQAYGYISGIDRIPNRREGANQDDNYNRRENDGSRYNLEPSFDQISGNDRAPNRRKNHEHASDHKLEFEGGTRHPVGLDLGAANRSDFIEEDEGEMQFRQKYDESNRRENYHHPSKENIEYFPRAGRGDGRSFEVNKRYQQLERYPVQNRRNYEGINKDGGNNKRVDDENDEKPTFLRRNGGNEKGHQQLKRYHIRNGGGFEEDTNSDDLDVKQKDGERHHNSSEIFSNDDNSNRSPNGSDQYPKNVYRQLDGNYRRHNQREDDEHGRYHQQYSRPDGSNENRRQHEKYPFRNRGDYGVDDDSSSLQTHQLHDREGYHISSEDKYNRKINDSNGQVHRREPSKGVAEKHGRRPEEDNIKNFEGNQEHQLYRENYGEDNTSSPLKNDQIYDMEGYHNSSEDLYDDDKSNRRVNGSGDTSPSQTEAGEHGTSREHNDGRRGSFIKPQEDNNRHHDNNQKYRIDYPVQNRGDYRDDENSSPLPIHQIHGNHRRPSQIKAEEDGNSEPNVERRGSFITPEEENIRNIEGDQEDRPYRRYPVQNRGAENSSVLQSHQIHDKKSHHNSSEDKFNRKSNDSINRHHGQTGNQFNNYHRESNQREADGHERSSEERRGYFIRRDKDNQKSGTHSRYPVLNGRNYEEDLTASQLEDQIHEQHKRFNLQNRGGYGGEDSILLQTHQFPDKENHHNSSEGLYDDDRSNRRANENSNRHHGQVNSQFSRNHRGTIQRESDKYGRIHRYYERRRGSSTRPEDNDRNFEGYKKHSLYRRYKQNEEDHSSNRRSNNRSGQHQQLYQEGTRFSSTQDGFNDRDFDDNQRKVQYRQYTPQYRGGYEEDNERKNLRHNEASDHKLFEEIKNDNDTNINASRRNDPLNPSHEIPSHSQIDWRNHGYLKYKPEHLLIRDGERKRSSSRLDRYPIRTIQERQRENTNKFSDEEFDDENRRTDGSVDRYPEEDRDSEVHTLREPYVNERQLFQETGDQKSNEDLELNRKNRLRGYQQQIQYEGHNGNTRRGDGRVDQYPQEVLYHLNRNTRRPSHKDYLPNRRNIQRYVPNSNGQLLHEDLGTKPRISNAKKNEPRNFNVERHQPEEGHQKYFQESKEDNGHQQHIDLGANQRISDANRNKSSAVNVEIDLSEDMVSDSHMNQKKGQVHGSGEPNRYPEEDHYSDTNERLNQPFFDEHDGNTRKGDGTEDQYPQEIPHYLSRNTRRPSNDDYDSSFKVGRHQLEDLVGGSHRDQVHDQANGSGELGRQNVDYRISRFSDPNVMDNTRRYSDSSNIDESVGRRVIGDNVQFQQNFRAGDGRLVFNRHNPRIDGGLENGGSSNRKSNRRNDQLDSYQNRRYPERHYHGRRYRQQYNFDVDHPVEYGDPKYDQEIKGRYASSNTRRFEQPKEWQTQSRQAPEKRNQWEEVDRNRPRGPQDQEIDEEYSSEGDVLPSRQEQNYGASMGQEIDDLGDRFYVSEEDLRELGSFGSNEGKITEYQSNYGLLPPKRQFSNKNFPRTDVENNNNKRRLLERYGFIEDRLGLRPHDTHGYVDDPSSGRRKVGNYNCNTHLSKMHPNSGEQDEDSSEDGASVRVFDPIPSHRQLEHDLHGDKSSIEYTQRHSDDRLDEDRPKQSSTYPSEKYPSPNDSQLEHGLHEEKSPIEHTQRHLDEKLEQDQPRQPSTHSFRSDRGEGASEVGPLQRNYGRSIKSYSS